MSAFSDALRSRSSWWTRSNAWNIAATIPRASPRWKATIWRAAAPKANSKNLEKRLEAEPLDGHTGIGHTRWATHGRPTENNAHPHATERVAVVHNGIIENFRELREALEKKGAVFKTETDTEIVLHLVDNLLSQGIKPVEAVKAALSQLRGAFALGFIFAGDNDLMIGARNGPPLAIGHGDGEMYLGSDAIALGPFTDTISYLEDGDWVVLTRKGATIYDKDNAIVHRDVIKHTRVVVAGRQGQLPPLHGQGNPRAAGSGRPYARPLCRYGDRAGDAAGETAVRLQGYRGGYRSSPAAPRAMPAIVAKYWFERLARVPVEVDVASEFRYREAPLRKGDLAIFISQSGETADTLAALRYAKSQGAHTLSVVNVPTSTIARESETVLPTLAGPEIGVASTKAFTCQLMVLAALAVAAGKARGELSDEDETKLVHGLVEIPRLMAAALTSEPQIEKLAREIAKSKDVLYLGRGTSYPLALEGALKLKEISYIHAEGYAAGELKHGPIALIDEHMPVVVIAPYDRVFEKTVSNMQEVAARGGNIILMTDAKGAAEATIESLVTIVLPDMAATFTPMVYAVPVQLLAYHTAVVMGTDVDQPRNLAKSVTVE